MKIRRAIYVERKHIYRSVIKPNEQKGQVIDSQGNQYNILIPEGVEYSDLMVIEKDAELPAWETWIVVDDESSEPISQRSSRIRPILRD